MTVVRKVLLSTITASFIFCVALLFIGGINTTRRHVSGIASDLRLGVGGIEGAPAIHISCICCPISTFVSRSDEWKWILLFSLGANIT